MGLEQRQVPCPRNVDEAQNNRDREHSLSSGSAGLGMPRDAPEPLQAGRITLSERRRFVMPGAWRMHSPGVRYRAKRGGRGILMIRAARRCEARAGKTQTRRKNEKSHPKVALSIL